MTFAEGTHWGRICHVRIGKKTGPRVPVVGTEFNQNLRIKFDITKTIYRTPNVATIKLYNLSEENENKIHDEYNDVEVDAGYKGAVQGIFFGNIKYVYRYKDGNDRITQVEAGDGDKDFKDTEINFTLAGGHTDEDAIRKLLEQMKTTALGYIAGKNLTKPKILGKTYSGTARKILDVIARNNDAHWTIQDGYLSMVPAGSTLPNEAIKVDSDSGLLGAPLINDKGISMKVQLDPRFVANAKLWLANNEVKAAHFKAPMLLTEHQKGSKAHVRLDPDGVYKVFVVNHKGDTRGNDADSWISEIKCVGLDEKIPTSKSQVPMSGLDVME